MTALLSYEWRRMRSLGSDRALLAGVVAFALLADLAAAVTAACEAEEAALQRLAGALPS